MLGYSTLNLHAGLEARKSSVGYDPTVDVRDRCCMLGVGIAAYSQITYKMTYGGDNILADNETDFGI